MKETYEEIIDPKRYKELLLKTISLSKTIRNLQFERDNLSRIINSCKCIEENNEVCEQLNPEEIQIYVVYHNERILKDYYLEKLDSNIFKLYYTQEEKEDSLNSIQVYINEFVAQDYILKHGKKTPYVGFCHYRRFHYLPKFLAEKDNEPIFKWNCFYHGFKEYCQNYLNNTFLYYDFVDFIKKEYKNTRLYNIFINHKDTVYECPMYECFICRWEYFEEIVSCISKFLKYIDEKYKLEMEPKKYGDLLKSKYKYDREIELPQWLQDNHFRMIAYFIEGVEGIYFGFINKNNKVKK